MYIGIYVCLYICIYLFVFVFILLNLLQHQAVQAVLLSVVGISIRAGLYRINVAVHRL